jgi:hypothetical protein
MTDLTNFDLKGFRLEDHEHQSGCPARDERQEASRIKTPREEILVKQRTADGSEVTVPAIKPEMDVIEARCCDCGRSAIFDPISGERKAPATKRTADIG